VFGQSPEGAILRKWSMSQLVISAPHERQLENTQTHEPEPADVQVDVPQPLATPCDELVVGESYQEIRLKTSPESTLFRQCSFANGFRLL